MAILDIEIGPSMRLGIKSDGPGIVLTIYDDGALVGPIKLTRTQALQAADEISEAGISKRIAAYFDSSERVTMAAAIKYFLANEVTGVVILATGLHLAC